MSEGRVLFATLLTLCVAGAPLEALPQFLGDQFQVNTFTTDDQYDVDIAADAAGDFVVVWVTLESAGDDTDSTSIAGQRFDSGGAEIGSEFQVNSYTPAGQFRPRIAMSDGGNFVVVWDGKGPDNETSDVHGRLYDSAGSPQGGQFLINDYTTHTQRFSEVDMDADGDFVVVYQSYGGPGDDCCIYPASNSVQARRFSSAGSSLGGQFQVNTYTTNDQGSPSVALEPDGDFVVVWDSNDVRVDISIGSMNHGQRSASRGTAIWWMVHGQRFASSGTEVGSQFLVNSYTTDSQSNPSVSADSEGRFIVVWEGEGVGSDSGQGIRGRRFSFDGPLRTASAEFQVNSYVTGSQYGAAVSANPEGHFVVTWSTNGYSPGDDNSGGSIHARDFIGPFTPINSDFQVNTFTTSYQYYSQAALAPNGNFVVVFHSDGSPETDSDGYSAQAQRFGLDFLFEDDFESGDSSAWQ